MKHRKVLMLFLAAAVALEMSTDGFGQKSKSGAEDDYNLKKAWEVLQNDSNDTDNALELLEKQLKTTPDNVEALYLRARIYKNIEEYASALTDLNRAIKVNKPKKTNYANSTLHAWKAAVYEDLGDFKKAEEEQGLTVALARKDNKESLPSFLRGYAHYLYVNDKYDESDAAYRECLKVDEGDTAAMVGLARNQIGRKNYDAAIEILEKCRTLSPEYAEVEHYEALAYNGKGETDKAIDRVIRLIDKDLNLVDDEMWEIMVKHTTYTIAQIRGGIRNGENPEIFKFILPAMLQKAGEYEDAFFTYREIMNKFGDDISKRTAECLEKIGLNELALEEIDRYLSKNREDINALAEKGAILKRMQRYEDALKVYDKIIEIEPTSGWGYYAKGWCFELMGNGAEAMKYYDTGIDIDRNYPYIFLMRGEMRQKDGNAAGAEEDFRQVVLTDTTAAGGSCRMYALHFLGQDKEAEEWMQAIIDKNPDEGGVWYDKACLLCRMGRLDESVAALRTAFDKGYADFAHIEADDDIDPIRERDDFKTIVEEYRKKSEERQMRFLKRLHEAGLEDNGNSHVTTEIAINRRGGGTFEVPCSVNGLDLKMFFDTGASDVTISSVEANFMLKNGQLSRDDIKGKKYYQIANGDIAEGTTVILREVKIGDAVLHNVNASVVHSQKAPLLLGQSALERFGTITIDNINSKLLIQQ